MIGRNSSGKPISFLDLLFNTLLTVTALFLISFLMISPAAKKADIETKAEYVITVTWPDDTNTDVDTWVMDPAENILWYRKKEAGLMHLDRDDRGWIGDEIAGPAGTTISYPFNQEIVTIRGVMPGEWIVNIHFYRQQAREQVKVQVKIEKLNPVVTTILFKEVLLTRLWDEVTVARMTMDGMGEITEINDLQANLVKSQNLNTPDQFVGGVY